MTGRSILVASLTLSLSAAAAYAADPPPAPSEERLICRGSTRQLSSRIRRPRRCLTAEQWREEDEGKALPISAQITGAQNDGRTSATPR
jgi:hypothetical protein